MKICDLQHVDGDQILAAQTLPLSIQDISEKIDEENEAEESTLNGPIISQNVSKINAREEEAADEREEVEDEDNDHENDDDLRNDIDFEIDKIMQEKREKLTRGAQDEEEEQEECDPDLYSARNQLPPDESQIKENATYDP